MNRRGASCYITDMGRMGRLARLLAVTALVAACQSAPPPPVTEAPPELIPLGWIFAHPQSNWGYRISPDGTRVGWITSHAGRATIHFRRVEGDEAGVIDTHSPRSVFWFVWARDSRGILYQQDRQGDENDHVYLASSDRPHAPPVDLTPWPGARSWIHRVPRGDPEHVVVGSNRRDRTLFDLYRVSLATGEATLIAENPGEVVDWMTDGEGRPRARLRHGGSDARVLEVRRDGAWAPLQTFDLEEVDVRLLGVTPDDRGLWLLSSRGRERRALLRVDLGTGAESVVHEHPRSDVEWVLLSERTRMPLVAFAHPDYPEVHVFDPAVAAALRPLRRNTPTGLRLLTLDDAERRGTVEMYMERGHESYLIDLGGTPPALLGRSHTMAFAGALGVTEPVTFTSRDGLRLHGYLTRPPGFRAPGPMVLVVHGGHWARDHWGYDRVIQFLANRGYAVLQVNYRGSTGYGRRFMEAAIGEYAGKMHDDLIDGVRWAVARRITDPARVAIYGGSYGGYAALVGMTFTPEVFACGVSVVGMSSLVTLFERMPAYWKLSYAPRFLKYIGDPYSPEGRRRLDERSPLFRADRAQHPILIIHGANDPRVSLRESEQMVEALQRAGKDVRFVVFPDEGHRRDYGNWRNAIRHYAEVERFLAACLGGRSSTAP